MTVSTIVFNYAHTVTYVTDKILLSLKEIIRETGLSPVKLTTQLETLERGIAAWLGSRHLKEVRLEIIETAAKKLVGRWDLEIVYDAAGDGSLWVDTSLIRYAIEKAGVSPLNCDYTIYVDLAPHAPDVQGWSSYQAFSTENLKRYSIGTTVGSPGLSARTSYWGA